MKTLLNWLLLVSMLIGALGASPLAQDVSVIAQAEEPPAAESPEPLELPYVPAAPDGSALQMPADTGEVGREPEQPPFSIQLEMLCDARGQTARLSWNVAAELAATLNKKSEVTIKLPEGLLPAEEMEFAPDGLLHLAASPQGEVAFAIRQDAAESGWLEANLTSGDGLITPALAKFTPGAYARLTAEGGQVEAKALGVSVNFPEKVLPAETAICIGAVTEVDLPNSLSGYPFQLNAYDAATGEEISKFDREVAIRVGYESERYGGLESQLKLFYFNRELQDWAMLPTEVDTEANTLTGYSTHFTPFDIKPQSWESARLPNLDGFAVSEFSGAATYTYPIELPAGAGGWQPSLALTYNSQVVDNANTLTQSSWAGMGWSLDTGYIQRNMGDNVGVFGANTDDTDTGNDGDDTFSLVLNGQSWRLLRLPDQDNNPNTIDYRTENESFQRIRRTHAHINAGYLTDNSTWEVWDKTGSKFTFTPQARYPIGCYSPFILTWQWPLATATNIHNQSITYTYAFDQQARRNGVGCDGAITQVAVYPATISYSGYQVVFDRSARFDHKAIWDTYPDEEYQTIFFQRSRLAAIRILSQNPQKTWELVRKYSLGYTDGAVFPNLLWNTGDPNSKTPSLVSITEYGSDGISALPSLTFTYGDFMHLTIGSNGYGGNVAFDYEGSNDRPWYEFTTTQNSIQEFETTQSQTLPFGSGLYGDFSLFDPGQMYKIELKVWPTTAACTAGYYYTISGTTTWNYATFMGEEIPSGANYKYMRWASFVTLFGNSARFFFNCSGTGQVLPYYAKAWPLVNRYRVTAKTVSENNANTGSTTAYTYTGASTNTPALSPNAGNVPYVKPRTEYRGSNSMTQIAPQGLATTTWYGQQDGYAGLPLAQMTAEQQAYDDFDTLDTSLWSYSHYGARQTLVKEESEPLLKMENPNADWSTVMVRNQPALQDGGSAVIQFKLSGQSTAAILALTNSTPNEWWEISVQEATPGQYYAVFQSLTGGSVFSSQTLLAPGSFTLDTWYVLMLTAGAEQFSARIWQRDNPAIFGQYSAPFVNGKNWQFLQYVSHGTLYLDDYREGPVYGLQLNTYAVGPGYTPPTIIPPFSLSGSTWYTGLAVSWLPLLQSVSFSLGESGRFTGTRQESKYDTAWQGNAQYGNTTHLIESYWTGSAWYPYRMTLSGYYPNVSLVSPVKNLVGLPGFSNSYQCEGDAACSATNARLLGSTWYLYDSHSTYNQPPLTGTLTGKRSLLSWGAPATFSDPRYLDEDYTYDGCGNLATKMTYNSEGTYSSRATSNPHKTETIYDSQHCTFTLETRSYYNATQYYATTYGYDNNDGNIRLGLLTRLTDPNLAVTTAGYDVFGRITSILRPGDSSGSPTLRFSYNQTPSLFWTQVEQLISGTTYYKARKFYNGLGQLIQTQEDASVGGTLQTVVTDTTYNNQGSMETQSVPYALDSLVTLYQPAQTGQPHTITAYDALGRVNTVTQPDATTTVTNYNIHLLNGQPTSVTYTEDARGNITETWQDVFGRLLKSQGAIGPAVTYTYDAADRLTSALYGNALTSISYDVAGRKLSLDDPDMGLWSYSYDALGNLTRQTDARGQRICLYYDGLNRMTGKHYRLDDNCPSSPTLNVSYGYDAGTNGKLQRTSMTDGSGSSSWTYTLRGLPETETKTITGAGTFATKYTYNSADLPTNMQYPADNAGNLTALPSLTYTYLPQMTLDSLGSYVTATTYDAAGRITNRLLGSSGFKQAFTYTAWDTPNQGGRLDTIKAGTAPNFDNLQNLDYGYDGVGNILTILDAANSSQKQCFTYDALNRLTRGTTTNDNEIGKQCGSTQLGNGNYDQSTTYDTATGNLSSKAGVSYGYYDTNHDHAVTHLGGVQKYWYDANGNQVTRIVGSDTYNLTYDAENRLVEVKKNNITFATFIYDGDGNRVRSSVNGVTTAFVGNHTEWEVGTASLTRYYYAGNTRVAMRKNNTVYYLLGDHLGSTSVTTDQNGQNPVKQLYAPWGEVRYSSGSLQTKYTYTGQYSNVGDFGLMFYNARWYDPYLNRWIQPDSIVPSENGYYTPLTVDYHEFKFLLQLNQENWKRLQKPNTKQPAVPLNPLAFDRYSYAFNDPVRYTDPDGHNPLLILIALFGAIIFFSQVPSDVYQPNPADQGDPAVMGVGAFMMVAPALVGPMLCGDGDCTNEATNEINFLSNNLNKVNHIMQSKHGWNRLVNLSGDISKDYQQIQSFISQTINNGTIVGQVSQTEQGFAVFQYTMKINRAQVVVNAFTNANGIIQIVDAWVK